MTAFALNRDYAWHRRDQLPWWARLPIVSDYALQAKLLRDVTFEVNGRTYLIPRGYRWNGVSAGMPFRNGKDCSTVMQASLIHDWLYDTRPAGVTQEMADALFLDDLARDGAPRWFQWRAASWFARLLYRWAWERGGVT